MVESSGRINTTINPQLKKEAQKFAIDNDIKGGLTAVIEAALREYLERRKNK